MKSFEDQFLDGLNIPHSLLRSIGRIREFKGMEELYRQQQPQILQTLKQNALIQSTESSNRIEGIIAPLERINALIEEKVLPNNRSEDEIMGYSKVLSIIHLNHAGIYLTANVILQLHRDMFRYLPSGGGSWKRVNNTISGTLPNGEQFTRFQPVAAYATDHAMQRLVSLFNQECQREEIEPLLLIPAFILDFLCIHPFQDGNGRMARLLTLLLLYQAGYEVGRYISLEKLIEDTKESYYDTLYRSSQGWHEAQHDLLPWTEYFLGILTAAYHEFEHRTDNQLNAHGAKTSLVLQTIAAFHGDFAIKDIKDACPHVSRDLIRKVLQEEKAAGRVEPLGRGPSARWRNVTRPDELDTTNTAR
ncbi:Fic family protein [Herpetosiphon giganteus]|uniref:Fic family protein n=1 Tax=Herpetosiphon giganteus TaxID=2029754 RepID=UPI001957D1B5|nr:Fic family protein [Herpetosiphon giganteus]MBM7846551.1 Fic family protein [Herpetosiphon giganteus]